MWTVFDNLCISMNRWLLSTAAVIWTQKTGIFLSRHLWWSKFLHVLNSLFRSLHRGLLAGLESCTKRLCMRAIHRARGRGLPALSIWSREESPTEAFQAHGLCFAVTVAFFFLKDFFFFGLYKGECLMLSKTCTTDHPPSHCIWAYGITAFRSGALSGVSKNGVLVLENRNCGESLK